MGYTTDLVSDTDTTVDQALETGCVIKQIQLPGRNVDLQVNIIAK